MTSTGQGGSKVRMGSNRRGRKRKLAAGAIALIFALVAAVATIFTSAPEDQGKTQKGCSSDGDCGGGRICASGGCLLLIPNENPAVWRNEVQNQLDPKKIWEPYPAFGVKLEPRSRCDVPREDIELPNSSQVTVTSEAAVYEVLPDGLWLHLYQTAEARIWIEAISWILPPSFDTPPKTICAGSGVSSVETGSAAGIRIAAGLKHTVPVGGQAKAEVSVLLDLPAANSLEERTLVLPLAAKNARSSKEITAAAFPLGADIIAMEGPVPRAQRLLDGFVAYYWEHQTQRSEAAVRFTLPEGKNTKRLDITSVRP